jgi:hypothetical protein
MKMTKLAILTGDTYQFRGQIKADGEWKWDAGRKAWIRTVADDYSAEMVERIYVRSINGIRNRGNFTVTLEEVV